MGFFGVVWLKPLKLFPYEREKNEEDSGIQDPGTFDICLRSGRPKFMVIVQNGKAN